MGQTTTQIEQHIEANRNELQQHLSELQERTQEALSWRARFNQQPMKLLGMAFGGGLLLSLFGIGRRW